MGKQLWWMQRARISWRRRFADFAIAFGTSAILGLGVAANYGGTFRIPMGPSEFSVPAHAWQYALWGAIAVMGGCVGAWIMSFGGHVEVTLRPNGVEWRMGRATRRFYPYERMQRCEVLRSGADGWLLRIVMQPDAPQGTVVVRDIAIASGMDPERVRTAIRAAGATVD